MTLLDKRIDGRKNDDLRKLQIERNYLMYPEGSVLISQGNTKVVITASIDESVPKFLQDSGSGWITAEYNMLPRATQIRNNRESRRGFLRGRTIEIQRIIGRSLRAAFNLRQLGERTIKVDCDVIQADGGTRCASITGGFIAVFDSIRYLHNEGLIQKFPDYVITAAISVGMRDGYPILDLNYEEDSRVDVDMNIIMNEQEKFIEVQGTAEKNPFDHQQLLDLLNLGKKGIIKIIELQRKSLNLK